MVKEKCAVLGYYAASSGTYSVHNSPLRKTGGHLPFLDVDIYELGPGK